MAVNSRRNSRRKRHRTLALIAAASVALVVGLVIFAVVADLRQKKPPPSPVPPSIVPPTSSSTYPHKPRPASQDASCPDVQLIAIPGTWESSLQDNPLNPVDFPKALLLNVTRPISEQVNSSRGVPRALPRPVSQSAERGHPNVLQRQPRRGNPRRGQGDDRHERQVSV